MDINLYYLLALFFGSHDLEMQFCFQFMALSHSNLFPIRNKSKKIPWNKLFLQTFHKNFCQNTFLPPRKLFFNVLSLKRRRCLFWMWIKNKIYVAICGVCLSRVFEFISYVWHMILLPQLLFFGDFLSNLNTKEFWIFITVSS